jgi:hypothetical protein
MDQNALAQLRATIELLEYVAPQNRLMALQNLVVNNGGRWDFPSVAQKPDGTPVYQPAIMEAQLFGVFAMAENLDELPKNWISAAGNIVRASDDPMGAAA